MSKKIIIPMSDSKTQHFINQAYLSYVQKAGYTPLLVPQSTQNLDDYITMADGLLLPGGIDIDPIYYGENNYNCRGTELEKDEFERSLLHKCVANKKPVFGICRGFQLLFRELQFEFGLPELQYSQHLGGGHNAPDNLSVSRKSRHHDIYANTAVLWRDGNQVNTFNRCFVNSMHHQGVIISHDQFLSEKKDVMYVNDTFGPVRILAYTSFAMERKEKKEYVIEAIEADWNGSRIVAVQWHPEELEDVTLLQTCFEGDMTNAA